MTQPSLLDLPEPRQKKAVRVPRTSVAVAQALGGYLEHRSRQVLALLMNFQRLNDTPTSAEIAFILADSQQPTTDQKLYIRRGLSDLLAKGAVEHAAERVCSVTKRRCVTWRVVSR